MVGAKESVPKMTAPLILGLVTRNVCLAGGVGHQLWKWDRRKGARPGRP
jgi:hypothetical protein